MKWSLACFLLLNSLITASQNLDSVKFSNGYLYYHTYGKGEPVLILTGGPGASYQQMEELAINVGKNHRAILLEQRGSGRSMPLPFDSTTINLKTALADLNLLLNHLKVQQIQVLGHSWGGMLAMSYASYFPSRVKSLILVDTGPFKLDAHTSETYMYNQLVRLGMSERNIKDSLWDQYNSDKGNEETKKLIDKWELIPVVYDRNKLDSISVKILKGGNNPAMGGLMFQSLFKEKFDLSQPLKAFKKPVHIICGSQDPAAFVSYELKILLPNADLQWVNRSGHFPMYEEPGVFYNKLFQVLK